MNLLDNALNHSVIGDEIIVDAQRVSTNYVKISFANRCENVNPEDVNSFFDKFYVGDKSRSESSTGLGLYICAILLKQHNFDYGIELNDDIITVWFQYLTE